VSEQTLSRQSRAIGYRKLPALPRHHAQAEGAIEDFKKASPRAFARSRWGRASASRLWKSGSGTSFDKLRMRARIGQKNKIVRRWAKRGTRPSASHDQRTASTYIFGAICPDEGKGAGLVLPLCNTQAMNLHLQKVSKVVAPGKHAVLLIDQAGWHTSAKLAAPAKITLVPLPPKVSRTQPNRKHLAIHAGQLTVQPRLQLLRRHPRPLLLRLEQAYRPAVAHHIHRHARLEVQVLINGT